MINNIVINLIVLTVPLLTGMIINRLAGGTVQMKPVAVYCALLVILQVGKAFLTYLSEILYVNLQSHAGYQLNLDTLEHVKRLPQSFFKHFDAAYYNQQINHDANDLVIFIIGSVVQAASHAISLVAVFAVLFSLNIRLGLVCISLAAVGGAMYWIFHLKLYKKSYDMQEQTAKFFSRLQDQLDKITFLRRHVLFDCFEKKLSQAFDELYPSLLTNQRTNARFALSNSIVSALAQGSLLIVGSLEVIFNQLQAGYLITALGYYASLNSSIQYFLTWGKDYQVNRVCYERLRRIWDIQEERNGSEQPTSINSIICENVGFSYPGNDGVVISGKYQVFKKGCLYGISGANGSGKSTFLELLLGMYPDDVIGSIHYNELEQREVDRYALRERYMGITEQEPPILEDTIKENLTMLCSYPEMNTLDTYINALGLHGMVSATPDGLMTVLDERMQNLSGGEKQKIAIIRQLMKSPSVMLFDEPTSALDMRSRKELVRILLKKRTDHLIIVVTHDKELLAACDEVLEFKPIQQSTNQLILP